MIKELALPREMFIAMIVRSGEVQAPKGHLRLEAGDHLFVLCRKGEQADVARLLAEGVGSMSGPARSPTPPETGRPAERD